MFSKVRSDKILQILVSYYEVRNLQKFMLKKAGEEAQKFGLHSERMGNSAPWLAPGKLDN